MSLGAKGDCVPASLGTPYISFPSTKIRKIEVVVAGVGINALGSSAGLDERVCVLDEAATPNVFHLALEAPARVAEVRRW